MNLEELYKSFSTDAEVRELLMQSHWFASFAEFDPKTGDTLPMPLNEMLRRISNKEQSPSIKDRLWLLSEHSRESAIRLMRGLSEEPRRESAYLPIRDVRELDTASFIALSRRPGRNIREKLADKPYMQAVRHFQSIDVPENRLLKSYLTQLAEALELRKKYLKDETVDDYLQTIYRWLYSDAAQEIARWENLAPNNALLSHRDYRRIWNSWRLLQSLSEDVERDLQYIQERRTTRARWEKLGKQYASRQTAFADMPVLIDYNSFSINPWDDNLPTTRLGGPPKRAKWFETREPACVDITQPQPVFATPSMRGVLHDSFFWQRWKNDETFVDIELFESDAGYAHPDAITVTDSDMFFFRGERPEILSQASRSFAQRLKKHFRNGRLIWLMPDSLSEFDLDLVRRNLNAAFSNAEPLPCSVAAVFKHIGYEQITHDGYRVGVIERINGKAYETEMIARFNSDLLEELPETRGFVWEKGASELISSEVEIETVHGRMPLLLRDGNWTLDCNPYGVSHATDQDLVMALDDYDCAIWLNGRPVEGGIKLYELQRRVPGIMLWRNHIPELMTKVVMDGYLQPFYFVGEGITVQPVRGKPVSIPVPQEFTLPMGQPSYELRLWQGSKEDALKYEAKLVSRDFPYDRDVKCRCKMTYTYGADEPYHLVFVPIDKSLKAISVLWQLKTEDECINVDGPVYPEPISWHDLQHQFNPNSGKESDFLEWCESALSKLTNDLNMDKGEPLQGVTYVSWKKNQYGKFFIWARTEDGEEYYIHENALSRSANRSSIAEGDTVYFYTSVHRGKVRAEYVSKSAGETRRALTSGICKLIHKQLYITFINIWADGRSVNDPSCPNDFAQKIEQYSKQLYRHMRVTESYPIRQEIRFLLCCMGKDAPPEFGQSLANELRSSVSDEKAIGFAIGDMSMEWQLSIMQKLLREGTPQALRAIAHAAWRSESVVDSIPYETIDQISKELVGVLESSLDDLKGSYGDREIECLRDVTKYLELLFALLRTRNSDNESIRLLLQPYQTVVKDICAIIDSMIELSVARKLQYKSRVVLDVSSRPPDDLTPDLLYALRIYLSGDSTANMIRITGIIDDE